MKNPGSLLFLVLYLLVSQVASAEENYILRDNKIYKLRARALRWLACSASGTWTASSRAREVHFALVGRCPRQIDGALIRGFREEDRRYCAAHHQLLVNPTLSEITRFRQNIGNTYPSIHR
jgi:hypothetical protein